MLAAKHGSKSIEVLFYENGKTLEEFAKISNEANNFFEKLIDRADYQVTGCIERIFSRASSNTASR